jgi:hypothetical protein
METPWKHPHENPLPGPETIAGLMGLEEFRVGTHYLREESRRRIGCICIESLWKVEVIPSFHERSVLAVATATGLEFRGSKPPSWIKAVFAASDDAASVSLESDPVIPALSGFDLFLSPGGLCTDGIGYRFEFETVPLRGSLKFGNPRHPGLIRLESTWLALAGEVVSKAGNSRLAEIVANWKEYVGDRRA